MKFQFQFSREQLDCYEKDLTVRISGEENEVPGSSYAKQLEKVVQDYKNILDKYESEDNTAGECIGVHLILKCNT